MNYFQYELFSSGKGDVTAFEKVFPFRCALSKCELCKTKEVIKYVCFLL